MSLPRNCSILLSSAKTSLFLTLQDIDCYQLVTFSRRRRSEAWDPRHAVRRRRFHHLLNGANDWAEGYPHLIHDRLNVTLCLCVRHTGVVRFDLLSPGSRCRSLGTLWFDLAFEEVGEKHFVTLVYLHSALSKCGRTGGKRETRPCYKIHRWKCHTFLEGRYSLARQPWPSQSSRSGREIFPSTWARQRIEISGARTRLL